MILTSKKIVGCASIFFKILLLFLLLLVLLSRGVKVKVEVAMSRLRLSIDGGSFDSTTN